MAINHNTPIPESLFSSDEFLQKAADNLERRLLITVSPEERHILSANRPLAKALFSEDNIVPFLADGSTTVGELNLKPEALYDVLRHPDIRRAISNGTLTFKDLKELPADRLASAKEMLAQDSYDPARLAQTLELSTGAVSGFTYLLRPASGLLDYSSRHPAAAAPGLRMTPAPMEIEMPDLPDDPGKRRKAR